LLPFLRSLASSPREEDRELWLRIAADILTSDDSVADAINDEFEADFLRCCELADETTRLAIAKRLAATLRAPPRLVAALCERIDAAGHWIMAHAKRLPDETMRRALEDPRRARALAERANLAPETIEDLAASEDLATLIALARNHRAILLRRVFTRLVSRAGEEVAENSDRALCEALLERIPMSAHSAPLFLEATASQRADILLAVQRSELGQSRPLLFGDVEAERLNALERHAIEGRMDLMASDLAAMLSLSLELARRIANDPSGEPQAVALAALGAPSDLVVRTLTALDIAERSDYRRLGALARLQGALSRASATVVIAALRGARPARTASPPPPRRSVNPGGEAARALRQRFAAAAPPRERDAG
jgi:hypothetical protein